MSNLWIRVSYGVLLAVILALAAGFAITLVIPGPQPPDTPSLTFRQLQDQSDDPNQTDALIGTVDRFFQDTYNFRHDYPDYQRNVLLGAVLLATVAGAVGIVLTPTFNYLRLGLTLGALLLLLWGAAFALAAVPNPAPSDSSSVTNLLAAGFPPGLDLAGRFLRFGASFIALLVFLFLGLWRLTEWPSVTGSPASSTPSERPEPVAGTAYPPTGESAAWQRSSDR